MKQSLTLLFILSFLGLFIHGDPPSHYYLPLYPIPIIFLSSILSTLLRGGLRLLVIGIILIIAFNNFKYYFSDQWFYLLQDRIVHNHVPYVLQVKAVEEIVKDANGRNFTLERVGPFDYFEGNYAQNYWYLFRLKGVTPYSDSKLRYIIDETGEEINISKVWK